MIGKFFLMTEDDGDWAGEILTIVDGFCEVRAIPLTKNSSAPQGPQAPTFLISLAELAGQMAWLFKSEVELKTWYDDMLKHLDKLARRKRKGAKNVIRFPRGAA